MFPAAALLPLDQGFPIEQLELRTGLGELFLGRLLNERHFFMYYLKLNYNRTSFMELCQKVLEMIKF